jgi:FixJ family two-component response regulator
MRTVVIYVVDDDQGVRDSLRAVLEAEGFAVIGFESAEDFLSHTPTGQPGCLVLDVHMPGMGGTALLNLLHENGTALPAIITTGRPDATIERTARETGAALLLKPYKTDDLLAAIERAIAPPPLRH